MYNDNDPSGVTILDADDPSVSYYIHTHGDLDSPWDVIFSDNDESIVDSNDNLLGAYMLDGNGDLHVYEHNFFTDESLYYTFPDEEFGQDEDSDYFKGHDDEYNEL